MESSRLQTATGLLWIGVVGVLYDIIHVLHKLLVGHSFDVASMNKWMRSV